MRGPVSSQTVLLAILLAVSQAVWAGHITTHLSSNLSSCEWCVCQGQTFAAPLPSAEPVAVPQHFRPRQTFLEITFFSEPATHDYESRAPPANF